MMGVSSNTVSLIAGTIAVTIDDRPTAEDPAAYPSHGCKSPK
jgi:hypothetical protein